MEVYRSEKNPIIRPGDIKPSREDFEVIGVFNAGAARYEDEVILLLRVAEKPVNNNEKVVLTGVYDVNKGKLEILEFSKDDTQTDFSDPRLIIKNGRTFLTSISHLRIARSKDGIDFTIDNDCAIQPGTGYETFGLEDPRITFIETPDSKGMYYINYVAVSPAGVVTALISTDDFEKFNRLGIIFCPENKNVVIFPEKIGGKYYALHRPSSSLFERQQIWLAESTDLLCWGNHRCLMEPREGLWDEVKIGAGAVPVRIEQGWLEIYHGVDRDSRYCLGAVMLDERKPWKIKARSNEPILKPEAEYERSGFFGNVVFSCGLLHEDRKLKVYYGAADSSICYAELSLEKIIQSLNPV